MLPKFTPGENLYYLEGEKEEIHICRGTFINGKENSFEPLIRLRTPYGEQTVPLEHIGRTPEEITKKYRHQLITDINEIKTEIQDNYGNIYGDTDEDDIIEQKDLIKKLLRKPIIPKA